MILLDVMLEALPERREEMAALLQATMAASQREPGCIVYRFGADLAAPDRFILTELWADEAALDSHIAGVAFAAFRAALPDLGRVLNSTSWAGSLAPYQIRRQPGSGQS